MKSSEPANQPGVVQRVEPWQRFTEDHVCPVCGGHDSLQDKGCFGYLSKDGGWAYCTRGDHAGQIAMNWGSPTFAHPLSGACPCGRSHADASALDAEPDTQVMQVMQVMDAPVIEPEPEPAPRETIELEAWLDGGLLRGRTSLLVGEVHSSKSEIARRVALAVVRGGCGGGSAAVRGRVLWVDLERRVDELRAAFSADGLGPSDEVHLVHAEAVPGLLHRIHKLATHIRPALIVVHALKPLLNSEEWSARTTPNWIDCEVASALDRILDLAPATGAHLLLLHHVGPKKAFEMGELLASTGREIDAVLVLAHPDGGSEGETLLIPIRESPQATAEGSSARIGGPPSGECDDISQQVLAYLRSTGRLVTQTEIVTNVNARKIRILYALKQLKAQGRLIQLGAGIKGSPFLYTGCDRVPQTTNDLPWLRRVRPWAVIPTDAELGDAG